VHCRGSSPTRFRSAQAAVSGSAIQISASFDESDFSVPSCARFNAVAPPLAAGTYVASYRTTSTLDPASVREIGALTVSPGTPATPRFGALSGNWFDPAEPGWGVNIVQGVSGALFAAWMTYDYDDNTASPPAVHMPLWLVMSAGRWVAPDTFRGVAYRTYPPDTRRGESAIRVVPAAHVTLTFESRDSVRFVGVMAYDARYLSGLQDVGMPLMTVTRTLRRFIF
jgi:hypothetical protein